mgnify:CR=1 FL=1
MPTEYIDKNKKAIVTFFNNKTFGLLEHFRCCAAGGSVVDVLRSQKFEVKWDGDIDVYPEDEYDYADMIKYLAWYGFEEGYTSNHAQIMSREGFSIHVIKTPPWMSDQERKATSLTPEKVLQTFDISSCQAAVTRDSVYMTDAFVQSLKTNTIFFSKRQYPSSYVQWPATIERIVKYRNKKGFSHLDQSFFSFLLSAREHVHDEINTSPGKSLLDTILPISALNISDIYLYGQPLIKVDKVYMDTETEKDFVAGFGYELIPGLSLIQGLSTTPQSHKSWKEIYDDVVFQKTGNIENTVHEYVRKICEYIQQMGKYRFMCMGPITQTIAKMVIQDKLVMPSSLLDPYTHKNFLLWDFCFNLGRCITLLTRNPHAYFDTDFTVSMLDSPDIYTNMDQHDVLFYAKNNFHTQALERALLFPKELTITESELHINKNCFFSSPIHFPLLRQSWFDPLIWENDKQQWQLSPADYALLFGDVENFETFIRLGAVPTPISRFLLEYIQDIICDYNNHNKELGQEIFASMYNVAQTYSYFSRTSSYQDYNKKEIEKTRQELSRNIYPKTQNPALLSIFQGATEKKEREDISQISMQERELLSVDTFLMEVSL